MNQQLPADLRQAAVANTSYRATSPDVRASGLRTHQLRHENLSSGHLPRVAEEFLTASRLRRWDRETALSTSAYFADPTVATLSELDAELVPDDTLHQLPDNVRTRLALSEAVVRRRSVRSFSGDPIGLPELATVLRHAGGITAEGEVDLMRGGGVTYRFRTVPSAGGLFPVELWVAALAVDSLDRAVYRYLPRLDGIAEIASGAVAGQLLETFAIPEDQLNIGSVSVALLYVARPWRSMRKYGPRGMRFVMHEIGGMSQNVHLTATALGLASVDCGGFYDDEVHAVLGLDGTMTAVLHTSFLGWQG